MKRQISHRVSVAIAGFHHWSRERWSRIPSFFLNHDRQDVPDPDSDRWLPRFTCHPHRNHHNHQSRNPQSCTHRGRDHRSQNHRSQNQPLTLAGACTTLLLIAQPGYAASDISGHWAHACLAELETRNILVSDHRDRLNPDQPLTRGDFATIIARAFADRPLVNPAPESTGESNVNGTRFLDVTAKHLDAAGVARADRLGFLDRYVDRVFYPDQYLNRWELWANVVDGFNLDTPGPIDRLLVRAFDDAAAIPMEVRPAIASAVNQGWIASNPEPRQSNPNATATRTDLAVLICRIQADQLPADLIPREAIASSQLQELRGVWLTNIDSTVLFSRRNLDLALTRLADLRFNTIYPTVWNWGYTLYPSAVAEATYGIALDPHPGLRRRDLLAEAVDRGKALGLRVIPWFEFGFQAPSDSALAQLHPTWLTQKVDGSLTTMEGTHERVWLNPFHPEVQEFILDLVVELVENYDIDGIQFDDHMGLPVDYGYDPYTIALYRAEHDGNDPPTDPHDPAWVAWRADKITQFMKRLFFAVKAIDNECVISVAPNPQEFAYNNYLQDWERWERMGLVEELVVQLYRRDLASFEAQLNAPELIAARNHIPTAIGVLAGLRDRPAETELMTQQLEAVRSGEFDGVAFFFYESLWQWSTDTPEEREATIQRWFDEEAIAPTVYEP